MGFCRLLCIPLYLVQLREMAKAIIFRVLQGSALIDLFLFFSFFMNFGEEKTGGKRLGSGCGRLGGWASRRF